MTIENAKVLHKHFLELGRKKHAEQLEARFPELIGKHEPKKTDSTDKEAEEEEQPKAEVNDGKKSKRRTK